MEAIIMAGGIGSRLRPLTCNMPKPLAPLCGRPVVEYIIELLIKHEFKRCALTLMYQGEKIEHHFQNSGFKGMELSYFYETHPLGTAGSVKNAAKLGGLSGNDLLVISADAMCDFDLAQAVRYHKSKNADATIVVKRVDDPREYGLVNLNQCGEVTGFLEKPSFSSCTTDLANTGVYILSQSALDLIPDNIQTDFAQNIFPAMLENGMRLCGYEENGYWCDIGDFASYIKCQRDMLAGRVKCDIQGHRSLEGIIAKEPVTLDGATIKPPCFIGKNVKIGRGTVIEASCVIGDNVTIGENSKLHASIILDGAYIGTRGRCNDAIICSNAKLERGSAVYEGAVIGENAVVGESATVESGVKLWQGRHLEAGSTASYDIKYGYGRNLFCDEDGISGETNTVITPQIAAKLGSSAVAISPEGIVGVAHCGGNAGRSLQAAFISGITAAGGTAWDFGECLPTEFDFSLRKSNVPIGALIESGITTTIYLYDKGGLPLTRAQERKLEGCLNRGEHSKAPWNGFGTSISMQGIGSLYPIELENQLSSTFKGIKAIVKSTNPAIIDLLNPILSRYNDMDGEQSILSLTSNGRRLSTLSERTGLVSHEKLVMLACESYFLKGKPVSLPFNFPSAIDNLAVRYGGRVHRYYSCSCDKSDEQAREIAKDCSFFRDGLILALNVLDYLSQERLTLYDAVDRLPKFSRSSRLVAISSSLQAALKKVGAHGKPSSDGVMLEDNRGKVLLHPTKTGKALLVYAESVSAEYAAELCEDYEKRFRDLSLDS